MGHSVSERAQQYVFFCYAVSRIMREYTDSRKRSSSWVNCKG